MCGTALVAGVIVGISLESWALTSAANADPALNATEAAYREIDSGPNPFVDGGQVITKIAKLVMPSVVHIQSDRQTAERGTIEETGSGIIVTSDKSPGMYVVTNRHVVRGIDDLNHVGIRLQDGRVIHPVQKWIDGATDIAVLKVLSDNLTPARWGDSGAVEIGNMVLAMGSPFGLSQSVTLGIISAKGRRSLQLGQKAEVLNQDFLQTDAAINPGNSGGPLIDLHGRVIGINTAIASNSGGNDGIGFSIPSNLVRRVVEELLAHGEVKRAYLGVKLDADFTDKTARNLKLDRARGARVAQVYPNTPASRAGLQTDDVVLSFDGTNVEDENHLINLVSLAEVGKKATLVVWRNGEKVMIELNLSNRADYDQQSEAPTQPGMGFPVQTMGLTLHEIDPDLADQLGFQGSPRGLLILKIDPRSPLAGQVQLYDLLEEVSRMPVASSSELDRAIAANASKDAVLLKVLRRERGEAHSHVVIWRR